MIQGSNILRAPKWTLSLLAMVCIGTGMPAGAGEGHSFVLRAGRVLPVSRELPGSLEPGVVIVRSGKIVAVQSADEPLPLDLPVIDFPDATVMPGLISAANGIGGRHAGDESVAAGYRALDTHRPYVNYDRILASGVTTVHLSPGDHRLVTGQGAVVKLAGPLDDRVLKRQADLTVNLQASAYDPPGELELPLMSSADVPIEPPKPQRPASRLGQVLALDAYIEVALADGDKPFDLHRAAFVRAWEERLPWRVQTDRAADITAAIAFLERRGRTGYLVGGAEVTKAADVIEGNRYPLIYRVRAPIRTGAPDLGSNPNRLADELAALGQLKGRSLALVGPANGATDDLRLAAATALRAGMSRDQVIEAVTRVPAEVLGVADQVGSLAPGMDADIIVLSGDPLATSSHVLRAYVGGEVAFEPPPPSTFVVRAGTIWVDDETRIQNGAVLVEDGKIAAVGTTVPHPPFAHVIDAGPSGYVAPGFIDAHGHLGMEGDQSATGPGVRLSWLVGVPDRAELRVARAGVTTTLLAPHAAAGGGSQVAAIKTAGSARADRVVRETAGVYFDVRSADPVDAGSRIKKRLEGAKKYVEKWKKYEKELTEWKERVAKGETVEEKPEAEESKKATTEEDPITGTWTVNLSGGPLPEPQTGALKLRLSGSEIDGRFSMPGMPEEMKVVATLEGTHISGYIDFDIEGMGRPEIEADIVENDHVTGAISLGEFQIDLDAVRSDKTPVEFKVVKRKKRGKGGRPLPPEVDEELEPLRAVLEGRIPLLVDTRSAAQIKEVLDVAGSFKVQMVLLNAEESAVLAHELVEKTVGVVVPTQVVRQENNHSYHQGDDLARKDVLVAFQSDREDGSRNLPLVATYSVERGMSADAALAALTGNPARMFKLDDRIGSLRAGMDADLVVFTGHPLEAGSRIERVIVGGEEIR